MHIFQLDDKVNENIINIYTLHMHAMHAPLSSYIDVFVVRNAFYSVLLIATPLFLIFRTESDQNHGGFTLRKIRR